MWRFFAGLLMILSAGTLIYIKFPIGYYLQPKQERLYSSWKHDISELARDPEFSKALSRVGKVEIHFTDPEVAGEFEDFHPPIKSTPNQPYILKISITRWIEKTEYGFVIQHELFDESDNKFFELGRTYKIGLIL